MENGGLAAKLSGLSVNDDAKDYSLIQVMNAVEAAETIIKQQADVNSRLRAELQRKDQELEILKLDKPTAQRSHSNDSYDDHGEVFFKAHRTASMSNPQDTLIFHHDAIPKSEDPAENHSGISRNNGILNSLPGGHTDADNAGFTQRSSPSASSLLPGRYPIDGDYGAHSNVPGQGLMPVAESNNSINLLKQDLFQKIREREEEILQLRKQLTDYSIKEAQIRKEKYVLEKRIAHMRMAFDQQQQDLVGDASKAISYRQDIIEENVRLTYQLEDAQQERTTFVSYLLPLLAEYLMQPPVPDAKSIVSSVKVLFKHLQEKLIITEAKLKESHYQLTPWRSDGNGQRFVPQSPQHSSGSALSSEKKGLELVPQPAYSPANAATEPQMGTNWDIGGYHARQGGLSSAVTKNMELDDLGRYSPLASRNTAEQDVSLQVAASRDGLHTSHYHGETINRHVKDPGGSFGMEESYVEGRSSEGQHPPGNWGSGVSPYTSTIDEPSSYSHYLQPVPEESSSSFSEAADDRLPAVEGLQISGEAYPGQELQATGFSINGTTCCNFEWVRHLEDGSINYIEGAKQPSYLVTADDIDTYLAIEIQPLDDRKRKGELVKVFANENRKITCDPAMQSEIEKNLYSGHASYTVSLLTGSPNTWELATLAIKRESYSINCRGPIGVINEKFLPATTVSVIYGHPSEFSIGTLNGVVHILRAEGSIPKISSLRDAIVLTLRRFMVKVGERKKGKKGKRRSLFGYF
ncbi:hypothetical protein Nepgr_009520 [Nepenthes gracilis]|uniref:Uncharacterized protein n=1 Tax=Nepenthes gracilis TaxID=150966 RepID=A0AAD3XKF2_NEPGR|nr:hypothetical protein Nepgr_009520 [Nepenthes gracilis]